MISADVTIGLDAAVEAVGAVDGSTFIQKLLGDVRVSAELEVGGGG